MATEESSDSSDVLTFMPLGSGQEVGRSCHYLQFKGKKIMLDCGIHPGMHGVDALPFVDFIDCEDLDLLLITHFHLDHCGALPWLLEKTAFRGRCFMTHATKAIYRMMIGDCIKIAKYGGGSDSRMLYTEEDLERSMDKIEVIDFHEQKEVNGIKFWCYVAGHVLGASMFMIEIAGIRTLYTGDFSRLEDRHLCAAELPNITPDVMICESTYGTQIHESRDDREKRFTSTVHEIVARGGRCLIPAFALGRAQELMLILDEYWEQHPELHDIPVYYASSLAKKCMAVYQTFVSGMNQRIQRQITVNNPFVFKHVSNLKSIDHFDDVGPCVVLASPGMLQNGLSRELFENWCPDSKNGCIIAGYCVEGTLAKHILSEPEEIITLSGQKLPMRLQVAYISFSAHTDYQQTSDFIKAMKPPHLILVHGEMNEMNRLKAGILRQYEDDNDFKIEVHNPRNTESVYLHFRGQKTAKVVGSLAINPPEDSGILSGVLVRRNFNYHLMHPNDLSGYTELSNSQVSQKMSVYYDGSKNLLMHNLKQLSSEISIEDAPKSKDTSAATEIVKMFKGELILHMHWLVKVIILEWNSNPVNDMYADAVLAAILHAQTNPILEKNVPPVSFNDNALELKFKTLEGTLRELCGKSANISTKDGAVTVEIDGKTGTIDVNTMHVTCTDQLLQHLLLSISQRMLNTVMPV
ncbi:pre-mRNA 3'-end-processing endonuclease polyadenylation factor c-term domain-containing protein [Ditylenchus destructor]|nr:pre-mRNA 3'-end-processing endonuclease polyadenylation factor c-term domain-containing protein [Ditylenchus destructor]